MPSPRLPAPAFPWPRPPPRNAGAARSPSAAAGRPEVRAGIVRVVSLVAGGEEAGEKLVGDAEGYIRSQARAGAEEAIPRIRAEVRDTARPYVTAAVVL